MQRLENDESTQGSSQVILNNYLIGVAVGKSFLGVSVVLVLRKEFF